MGLLLFVIASRVETEAQEPAKKSGVVTTAEKVNKKSADINAASNQVLNESQQVAGRVVAGGRGEKGQAHLEQLRAR